MNARPKKKLCWNCEGSVSLKAEICPYCGVSVVGLSADISDVPIPPYRLVNAPDDSDIPISPYQDDVSAANFEKEELSEEPIKQNSFEANDSKQIIAVLSMLLVGSVFFIFGFALLLFSEKGMLSLQWDASYWYVYLCLALPMLFFGFRQLNSISLQEPE